jgi:serine/threonine protein phosphatase PrpC
MSSTTTSNIKHNTTAPKMFYKFEHSCRNIPHPEKQWKGGEDAYFAHDNILVVADGVGGWAEFGIDASLYSKKLVQLIYENFYSDKQPLYIQQPSQLIQDSVAMNK